MKSLSIFLSLFLVAIASGLIALLAIGGSPNDLLDDEASQEVFETIAEDVQDRLETPVLTFPVTGYTERRTQRVHGEYIDDGRFLLTC